MKKVGRGSRKEDNIDEREGKSIGFRLKENHHKREKGKKSNMEQEKGPSGMCCGPR